MPNLDELLNRYKNLHQQQIYQEIIQTNNLDISQKPHTLVIACADSRIEPAILLQSQLGELFVARNIANIVPAYNKKEQAISLSTQSILEFAVCFLKVSDIVILGHSQCGGVHYWFDRYKEKKEHEHNTQYLDPWLHQLNILKDSTVSDDISINEKLRIYEQESIRLSYYNLLTYPFIQESLSKKELKCHAWYLDIISYNIFQLKDNIFESI